jgi:DNA polymerase III subunit epsilon
MKKIFIDVETTGTNSYKNDLVQLAAIIEIDGVEQEKVNILSRPTNPDNIEDEALKVIGKTKEELMGYPEHTKSFRLFKSILGKYVDPYNRRDKMFFIGYNARFDEDFVRSWFYKCGDSYFGSWFFWPAIDISNLCALIIGEGRADMPNFKLMTVASRLGIPTEDDKAHDAMYDILITRRIYKEIVQRIY